MTAHRPLVDALRLESLIARQRRTVFKRAQQLEDAEAIRVVLEAELARVRSAVEPVAYEWPPAAPASPPQATDGPPDRLPSRDGEATLAKTAESADDPERGSTVARSGGPGRQATTSSVPGVPPAASAEQLAPSGTAGAISRAASPGANPPESSSGTGTDAADNHSELAARAGNLGQGQAKGEPQVVPGLAPGGVSTSPDSSAPNAGGDARPESARFGASRAQGVAAGRDRQLSGGSGHARGDSARFGAVIDMTGQVLGDLTVVERRANSSGKATWLCRCTCGRTCVETGIALRYRASTPKLRWLLACRTCRETRPREEPPRHTMPIGIRGGSAWGKQAKDETGKRYGKLQVIERAPNDGIYVRWRCGCDCGAEVVVMGQWLRNGRVSACPTCSPRKHTPTCSRCGEPGHNVRSCATAGAESAPKPAVAAGHKRCCQCRTVKPVADFYAHTASGKYQARCKLCDNATRVKRSGGIPGAPPGPRPKKSFTCFVCAGLPHRVEGVCCRGCGLERAEESFHAEDFTSGESPLGRASGG